MKRIVYLVLVSFFMFAATSALAADKEKMAPSAEKKADSPAIKFMKKAAIGGMLEVQMGKIATEKATDPQVKAFGERMVKDHSAANEKLRSIAQAKGVKLPAALNEKHKKQVEKFKKMKGSDFDREYMAAMVKDHEKDVKEFDKNAQSLTDPEVKQFAQDTLPTLKEHLQMAKDIHKKLGGK